MHTETTPEAFANLSRELTVLTSNQAIGGVGQPVGAVRLVCRKTRRSSTLYQFRVASGRAQLRMLVKVPIAWAAGAGTRSECRSGSPGRPQLFLPLDPFEKAQFEHAAMARIQRHFETLGDPRFGFVRVYGFLPNHRALVMEQARNESLSKLLIRVDRFRGVTVACRRAALFHNAGAWLREYQQLPGLAHTQKRHVRRQDFCQTIEQFTRFLENASGNAHFAAIRAEIMRAAERFLPDELPLGMAHGDFAPRNILVGPGDRVTVLDTVARWYAPVFEDIGQFLIGLKAHRLQAYSQGLLWSAAVLKSYEREFLRGYFADEPVVLAPVRLFECLAALEKWSSVVHAYSGLHRWWDIGKRCVAATWVRHMRRTIAQLLDEINEP